MSKAKAKVKKWYNLKTITESNNIKLREAIIDHVSMMVTRLEEGKNPKKSFHSNTNFR